MPGPDYNAPALDRGLSILEFMADKSRSYSIADLSRALGKSKTEIYRLLITLEKRGYLERDARDGHYAVTGRLFDIGMRFPPRRQLIDIALPWMRQLARRTSQSCHISLFSEGAVMVLVTAESDAPVSFAVKPGFRAPLVYSTSGRILYAFQSRHEQALLLNGMRNRRDIDREDIRAFLRDARTARAQGHLVEPSALTHGITDISVPIFRAHTDQAVATLVVPFISHRLFAVSAREMLEHTLDCAASISREVR